MIPERGVRSIPALAQWAARTYGDAEAVVDGDTRLSFTDLAARAHRATRAAIASGIQPGDRVALWAPNSWEWIVAALGILGAGAWLVPLNTRFKGEEAAYVLERADARALFTVRGFLDTDFPAMLRATQPSLRCLDAVVLLDGAPSGDMRSFDDHLTSADAVDPGDATARIESIDADDVSDVIFTSGTTGRPKGVMLRHGASLVAFDRWARRFGLRAGDRYVVVNPFFHCFGYKAGWMACLQQGATALPLAVLDVDHLVELITRERVSALPGPPTMFVSLLDAHAASDLSSLRIGFVGAATVAPELLRRIRTELPFEALTTGYGLTESTAMVSITRPDDEPEHVAYWNGGYPIDGVELRIADDHEILVRGFNVMAGYLDDPAATAAAVDDAGWLHTGDIGALSDDGALRISDRKKDIFISGGFNVSPAEVENLLLGHPGVAQVAVVGMPDDRLGEVGAAFVVAREGGTLTADDLTSWAREHLANYKVPRRVELTDALPLNASGKVVKGVLREQLTRSERAT